MDFWNKARSFAEEAAKRTQDLTKEAAKRSQDLSFGSSTFSDIVAETTKRSKEIAAEASKRADQIRIEAIKRADQIKHLADGINAPAPAPAEAESYVGSDTLEKDLERFGITEELREFIKGITPTTFRDFPLEDDTRLSDVPTVSNVRQDLTEWQEKHANLVLSTVKEISKLRYELCPRVMKERKFWRIYFILMNSHVAPYEKRYMEDAKPEPSELVDNKAIEPPEVRPTTNKGVQEYAKPESSEQVDNKEIESSEVRPTSSKGVQEYAKPESSEQVDNKAVEPPEVRPTSSKGVQEVKKENRPSSAEQDLDEFLLGDSDEDPGDKSFHKTTPIRWSTKFLLVFVTPEPRLQIYLEQEGAFTTISSDSVITREFRAESILYAVDDDDDDAAFDDDLDKMVDSSVSTICIILPPD
ncbi:synapse-associated protein of 47 kDa-like [Senna tora]|uniref:Synapse-associated protein of 47 kDa-like n=1 Tax=Senna tora TaxID=362788 RepID=A0A835CH05_9FABA|nr:synapse-associated protein of 47 kDa-like [Senna tora]